MSAHALYVTAAYGISAVAIVAMLGWILADRRSLARQADELEASGVRRRSEARKPGSGA